uniref:BTB domain-containing protein n=1 Tax=Panagrolaimus sp. ES5 TaxID=591445 RepID=A0AC34EZN2_9BILA
MDFQPFLIEDVLRVSQKEIQHMATHYSEDATTESKEIEGISHVRHFMYINHNVDDKQEDDPESDMFTVTLSFYYLGEQKLRAKFGFYVKSALFVDKLDSDVIFSEDDDHYAGVETKLTLGHFLWERNDHDFVITVGKDDITEIKIHKNVLASRSPVFDAMLQTDMKEKAENRLEIIDFDVEVVQAAVEFFYDRETYKSLDLEKLISLLQFAEKYDIKDFKTKIEYAFLPHLYPETVCQIASAALTSNSSVLKNLCLESIIIYLKFGISFQNSEMLDKDFMAEIIHTASK